MPTSGHDHQAAVSRPPRVKGDFVMSHAEA